MPTWRRWLADIKSIDEFKETDYYKNWFGFLKDERLINLVEKYHYSICYYVHPVLNKYLDIFKGVSSNIKFLNSKDGNDIQSHLKSAKILITDFSSVFFDFAYMKKPMLFFQFDEDKYYESHYIKAYFDYRRDGFRPVCIDIDNLNKELDVILHNNSVICRTSSFSYYSNIRYLLFII